MKVGTTELTDLGHDERQLIYDALYVYLQHCNRYANSQHVGAYDFQKLEDRTEKMILALREAWPDLLH